MTLNCCKRNCLMELNQDLIQDIRKQFDDKLYNEQNSYLNSLININFKNEKNVISYHIRDTSGLGRVKVCKTSFLKIFGIGKRRIDVLLKKMQPYSGSVTADQRPTKSRNQKKLPVNLKAEVRAN